jgi:hypothetical protein
MLMPTADLGSCTHRPPPRLLHTSAYVSIRQHTSAYVSIRQHTSAYVSIRTYAAATSSTRQHTSAHVSTRQHTQAYVSIRQAVALTTRLLACRAPPPTVTLSRPPSPAFGAWAGGMGDFSVEEVDRVASLEPYLCTRPHLRRKKKKKKEKKEKKEEKTNGRRVQNVSVEEVM